MRLDEWLSKNAVTMTEMAALTGRSVSTISRLARGLHRPGFGTADAIRHATGGAVTPNDFLSSEQDTAA
jgi:transcriptional regulator with XRE-family HTH domain